MILFIIVYIISGVLAYGLLFAFWQRSFPSKAKSVYNENLGISIFFGLLGFVGLFVVVLNLVLEKVYFKYGLKFK